MTELKDTVNMMTSKDYKERFKAEYEQLSTRLNKLDLMISKYENGLLDFTPDCPIELLKRQKQAMAQYFSCLRERAEIEGIDL